MFAVLYRGLKLWKGEPAMVDCLVAGERTTETATIEIPGRLTLKLCH